MTSPTAELDIEAAIDAAVLAGLAPLPVVFENTDYAELSSGEATFVRSKITFSNFRQLGLGNQVQHRVRGSLFLIIHCRSNTGNGERNLLIRKVVNFLRSKKIGGATFFDVNIRASGSNENWAMTGLECPFYYDLMS